MKGGEEMKDRCKFSEKIYMYIDNQLDEQQKAIMLEHMEKCNSCKEEFELFNVVQNEFKGMEEVKLPNGYHQKLHMKLVKAVNESNTETKRSYFGFMNKFVPIAAAMLLVFVTVKGVSVYNAMTAKNNCLASTAGAQMDSLSVNDSSMKSKQLSKLKEEPKAKNMPEDSLKAEEMSEASVENSNEKRAMTSSMAQMAPEAINSEDIKKADDSVASVKADKAVPQQIKDNLSGTIINGFSLNDKGKGLKSGQTDFETVEMCTQSGVEKQQNIIIQGQEAFKGLWELTYKDVNPVPLMPEIDFEKYTVVAVFMGQKPTGGYGIEITKVEENEKNIVVTVKQTSPLEGSMVTEVLTSPAHIVKIKKTDKEIIFNK